MFRFAASSLPVTLRQMGLVAMACSMAALSACGGGSRAKAYAPDRIVSFGDENSLISSYQGGLKDSTGTGQGTLVGLVYTINSPYLYNTLTCVDSPAPSLAPCSAGDSTTFTTLGATDYGVFVDAAGTPASRSTILTKIDHDTASATHAQKSTNTLYSCTASSIWIQVIAHDFGRGYKSQCPTDADGATTYAQYHATVAMVVAQVAAHRGELGQGVLVTLMAGQRDILDLYASVQNNTISQASAEAELKNRAGTLANAVKDIMSTGAKVVLALTPDLGQSPMAANGGNQPLLASLTKVFNDTLYITNLGNQAGRDLAGVNPEPFTNPTIRSAAYDYTTAACTATLRPDGSTETDDEQKVKFCTASTLVSTTTAYMWADNTHFTPAGHSLIGSAGFNRAYNQF
jgi:outer membrane lipase/esterase